MKPGEQLARFITEDQRPCVLRSPSSSDLDGLLKFANRFVEEKKRNRDLGIISFDSRLTKKAERKWLDGIVEGVRGREVVSVAAFVGGKVVGHCDVHRRKLKDVRHTGVLGIAVLDGYRGVGIGERLMAVALREARKIGIRLVELQVFAINEAAIHLYEKMGFRPVGVVPKKMLRRGRYYDEVAMFADLRGTDKSTSRGGGES